jgi:20S proteasome alpha/beta subunit
MEPVFLMVIAVVAIGCGTGLIKTWMEKHYNESSIDEESFEQLAKAFIQHKKEMQERVRNLEAIVTDEDENGSFEQIEAPEREGILTNDLKEKDRVRS